VTRVDREPAPLDLIVDAHQHYWNLAKVDYPWLTPEAGAIYGVFEEEQLAPRMAQTGVTHTVAVQSANSCEDTDYLLDCAHGCDFIAGVVGWVPLDRPDECAAALDRYCADPLFRGMRHLIHNEADPDWIVRPEVIEGLTMLAERGLPFDVVAIWPLHMPHLETIAEKVPGLSLMLDHLGKPDLSRGIDPAWVEDLKRAAQIPGLHAKFSGLNTPYVNPEAWRWTWEDFVRPLDLALEFFGPERVVWGSDWPISVFNGDYVGWYDAARAAAAHLSTADQAAVFGGNAARFYSLPVDAGS